MANAGGAWDNAKKIVETEMHAKGTDLHTASVVGDTVGDPFKDTASVAMNPIIKFTTLFGLLAVEMAVGLQAQGQQGASICCWPPLFLAVNLVFVFRSFYGMRILAKKAERLVVRRVGATRRPGSSRASRGSRDVAFNKNVEQARLFQGGFNIWPCISTFR
jgi:hypothetical protein